MAVAAKIAIAQIIRQDEDDVGGRRGVGDTGKNQNRNQTNCLSHPLIVDGWLPTLNLLVPSDLSRSVW
jgi:hypothetical protein